MPASSKADVVTELVTLRDFLRYGVSQFNRAGLVYGHGTSDALDEAAFLILHTLSLPINTLEPWLEARLSLEERERVFDVLLKRVTTRLPAPYLVGEAWIGPYRFFIDERAIIPRSYIGELLCGDISLILDESNTVTRVLDLCTGSACLAILATFAFPHAKIDAVDLSSDALEVAKRNVAEYGLEDVVRLIKSDLFSQINGACYDLIIANPPYVTSRAVSEFPPEYACEPRMAHAGGADGFDLVRVILEKAAGFLSKNGKILVEVGQGKEQLEAEYPDLPFFWLDTENSQGEVFALSAHDLKRLT